MNNLNNSNNNNEEIFDDQPKHNNNLKKSSTSASICNTTIDNNNNNNNNNIEDDLSSTSSSSSWKYATTKRISKYEHRLSPATPLKVELPPPTFYFDGPLSSSPSNSLDGSGGITPSTSFSTFPNMNDNNNNYNNEKSQSDYVRKSSTPLASPSSSPSKPPISTANGSGRKQTLLNKVKYIFNNSNSSSNSNSNSNSQSSSPTQHYQLQQHQQQQDNEEDTIITFKNKFSVNILEIFQLPEFESVLSEHPCAYRRKVSKAGKLYITNNYFCFYSLIFNKQIKKYSDFKDVLSIKKISSVILGHSIEITTTYKKYVFGMFENTETAFNALSYQHKLSVQSPRITNSPKKSSFITNSNNDGGSTSSGNNNFEKKRNRFFSVSIQSPTKSILKETNHPIILNNNYNNSGSYTAPSTPIIIPSTTTSTTAALPIPINNNNNSNSNTTTTTPTIVSPTSITSSSPSSPPKLPPLQLSTSPNGGKSSTLIMNTHQESRLKPETRTRSGSLPSFGGGSSTSKQLKKNKVNNLNYLLSPVKDKDSKIVLAAEEDQDSLNGNNSGSGSGGSNNTPISSISNSPYSQSPNRQSQYFNSNNIPTITTTTTTNNKKSRDRESHKSIAFGQNILISLFSGPKESSNQSTPIQSPRYNSNNNENITIGFDNTSANNSSGGDNDQPITPRERSNTTALVFKPFKKNKNPINVLDPNKEFAAASLNKMLTTRNARGDVQHYCFKEDVFAIPLESMRLLDDSPYPVFLNHLITHLESTKESIELIYINNNNNNNNNNKDCSSGSNNNNNNCNNNVNIPTTTTTNINATTTTTTTNIEIPTFPLNEQSMDDLTNNLQSSIETPRNKITIELLIKLVTRGKEDAYKNLGEMVEPQLLGGLLIHFFKVLPNVILPDTLLTDTIKSLTESDKRYKLSFIRSIIFSQPQIHWTVLKSLLSHLVKLIQLELIETTPNSQSPLSLSSTSAFTQTTTTMDSDSISSASSTSTVIKRSSLTMDIIEQQPLDQDKLDIIQFKVSNIFGPILFKITDDDSIQQHDNAILVFLFIIQNYNLIFDLNEHEDCTESSSSPSTLSNYIVKKGNQVVKNVTVNQILLKLVDIYYKDDTFVEIVNLCHNDYFLSTESYIQSLISIYSREKHFENLEKVPLDFRMKIRERVLFLIRSVIEFKPMFWGNVNECTPSLELIQDFTEKYFDQSYSINNNNNNNNNNNFNNIVIGNGISTVNSNSSGGSGSSSGGGSIGSSTTSAFRNSYHYHQLPSEEIKYFQFFNDFYKRILQSNNGFDIIGIGSIGNSNSGNGTPTTLSSPSTPTSNPIGVSSDSILMQRQLAGFILGGSRTTSLMSLSGSDSSSKKFNFCDLDSMGAAIQITLIDEKAFRMIPIFELLKKKFVRPDLSPNFQSMVQLFNRWSSLVGSEILNVTTPDKRALVIEKFIEIAHILLNFKNFHCCYAITQGIYHYSIKRLYMTWDKVSKKSMNQFEELQKIFSTDLNHKNYREILNSSSSSPPLIPYLGLYTKDLLVAEDSNPTLINNSSMVKSTSTSKSINDESNNNNNDDDEEEYKSTQLINFEKLRTIHTIIKNFRLYKSNPYPMPSNQLLRDKILSRPILNDDEMFDKSLLLEPRRVTRGVTSLPLPNLKNQALINNLNNNNN